MTSRTHWLLAQTYPNSDYSFCLPMSSDRIYMITTTYTMSFWRTTCVELILRATLKNKDKERVTLSHIHVDIIKILRNVGDLNTNFIISITSWFEKKYLILMIILLLLYNHLLINFWLNNGELCVTTEDHRTFSWIKGKENRLILAPFLSENSIKNTSGSTCTWASLSCT